MAEHQNGPAQAIINIETELGIGLKGSQTDLKTRLAVLLNLLGAINGGNAFPVSPNPTDGQLFWRNDLKQFYIYDGGGATWKRIDGVSDHSLLGNLLVDTHTQYLDVAGTRPAPVIMATNGLGLKGGTANAMTLTGTPTAPRTITIPDATDTIALLGRNQTFTGNQTFNGILAQPNIPAGRVGLNVATLAINATTMTPIQFDTKDFDYQTEFDIVTNKGRYTAKNSGLYHVIASIPFSLGVANAGTQQINLYKTGVSLAYDFAPSINSTNLNVLKYEDNIPLNANDYLDIRIYLPATGTVYGLQTYAPGAKFSVVKVG